jgi:SRSO17 transposase
MRKQSPLVCWIVDDTRFPKKGSPSVGVARQYCGQVGKQENCRVAVSLSVASWSASLPIAFRLYLPEGWTENKQRRQAAGIPDNVRFRPNRRSRCSRFVAPWKKRSRRAWWWPMLVWSRRALPGRRYETRVPVCGRRAVLAFGVGAGHPTTAAFAAKAERETTQVATPGQGPSARSVKELAFSLPLAAWRNVNWREGTRQQRRSRFALPGRERRNRSGSQFANRPAVDGVGGPSK